jgi:NAD(P)-dependent dehydrogenase (short-subunit alcohol dehydrogenase family)
MLSFLKILGDYMLIEKSNLLPNSLKGKVAIVTGGGRGIGYETARALVWLGANVVLAEINDEDGQSAAENIAKEFGEGKAIFIKTDVGSEKDIERLSNKVVSIWEKVDFIINNATVFYMGEVKDTPIEKWDISYRVNLRGPVLLARAFMPDMIKRKEGVFVCVSSSGAAPFMGAYEVLKTAQVELANTIAAEVEGKGVYAFTIGPGIVKTPGFIDGGGQVAKFMGITLEQLLELNKKFEISPEAAGVGFAAAVALASKYHGQETSSIQVLKEIGIVLAEENSEHPSTLSEKSSSAVAATEKLEDLIVKICSTYEEQSSGWKKRSLFERQWISRDFKKTTSMSIDEMQSALSNIKNNLQSKNSAQTLKTLESYYKHQREQLNSFEKNPDKLKAHLLIIDGWIGDINRLLSKL